MFSSVRNRCRASLFLAISTCLFVGCATDSSGAANNEPAVNRPKSPDDVEPVKPETLGPAVSVQTTSSRETTDADFSVRKKQMEYFLKQGPSYALNHVETEPVITDDRFRGYRITAMTSAARRHMGNTLQKGDVVTRVNGQKLDEPKSYMSVWKSLPDRSKIKLVVRRSGNIKRIKGVVR